MPVFTEGQDPRDPLAQNGPGITGPLVPPDPRPNYDRPDPDAVWGAAFRLNNPVVSLLTALHGHDERVDPNHNPFEMIRGTKYDTFPNSFIGSRNETETRRIMANIDQEERDRENLASAGTAGTVASLFAGLTDPTIFLPIGGAVRSIEGGYSVLKSAASVGLMSGLQAGVSEGALQLSQQMRDPSEAPVSVASATLLGALLGGGAAAMLSRSESRALTEALDADRIAISRDAGLPAPRPAGAAAADLRTAEPASVIPPALRNLLPPSVQAFGGKWLMGLSPTQRAFFSHSSIEARKAISELIEIPFEVADSAAGITTTRDGLPPVGRQVWQYQRRMAADASHKLEDEFLAYRYGDDGNGSMVRAKAEDLFGKTGDKMTFAQFKEKVSEALRNGDVSDVPQAQAVAQHMRANIFDPLEKRLVDAGLLGAEDIAPKGDKSFFSRVYNKEAIAANRPEFHKTITDWLEGEQTTKARIQDDLRGLVERRSEIETRMTKLEGEEDALRSRPSVDDVRLEEIAVLKKDLEAERARLAAQIETDVRGWRGRSAKEAIAELEKRVDEVSTRGATAVDRAVNRILESDRAVSRQELDGRAQEIIDRIMGGPDGRLPYDAPSGGPREGAPSGEAPPRGSLHSRDFAIPSALITKFLENDVEHVLQTYLRTVLPDMFLHERFGDVEMKAQFRALNEEYAAKSMAAKGEKERTRLEKERQAAIRDLAAIRDRVRNVYGVQFQKTMPVLARFARMAKNYSAATDLGTAVFNSMPDMSGIVFRNGLEKTFGSGWRPFFSGLMSFGKSDMGAAAKRQAKAMQIAVETQLNLRSHALNDVLENYRPGSKMERGLAWAADKSQLANFQAPFTDMVKTVAASVATDSFITAIEHSVAGKATKADVRLLASNNINEATARAVWKEIQAGGGEKIDGINFVDIDKWADRAARDSFEAAVAREVDLAVVTPGHEKPLAFSNPVLGLLGQFKSFVAATHERVLIPALQRRDANTLAGLFSAVGAGMLSYALYSVVSGRALSDRPQDWIKEGVSRSGVLGWFDEANNSILAKLSSGKLDAYRAIGADRPLSRMQQRSAAAALLGPTMGKVDAMFATSGAAFRGEWSQSDTTRLRRFMVGQNLFYLRNLLNVAESGINEKLGVPAQKP
jgi:hypothetical protein